ncbi:MAG TPA: hypothetical protein VFR23_25385 [Jiangellaceae bacterium]|nr:hypothetical protein [Jiangellaceae bacterium]
MSEVSTEMQSDPIEQLDTEDDLQAWDPEEIEDPYASFDSDRQDDAPDEEQ